MQTIPVTSQIPPHMCGDELARIADRHRTIEFDLVEWESLETCSYCPVLAYSGDHADGEAEVIYQWGEKTVRRSVCGGCLGEVLDDLVAKFPLHPIVRDTLIVRVLLAVEGAA